MHQFKRYFSLFSFLSILFVCCNNQQKMLSGHTSQNSLDWQGVYSADFPCTNCDKLEIELRLNNNETFVLINRNLKGDQVVADTFSGQFKWMDGNYVQLLNIKDNNNPSFFKVGENQLFGWTKNGEAFRRADKKAFVLYKEGNKQVEGKKWQLERLMGSEIDGTAANYYLNFLEKKGSASAKVGCNIFTFGYTIRSYSQIHFSRAASTLMACPNDTLEQTFVKVLAQTTQLNIEANKLILQDEAGNNLAEYTRVEAE